MKSHGLLHGELLRRLAELGADEAFVLGHCGLAAAPGQALVDLAIGHDLPRLLDVLDVLWPEVLVAEVMVPDWLEEQAPESWAALATRVGPLRLRPTHAGRLLHEASRARFVVRSGETRPVTLVCRAGVPWNELEESRRSGGAAPARARIDEES